MMTATELRQKRCKPCEGGVTPLAAEQIRDMMSAIPQWHLAGTGKSIPPSAMDNPDLMSSDEMDIGSAAHALLLTTNP